MAPKLGYQLDNFVCHRPWGHGFLSNRLVTGMILPHVHAPMLPYPLNTLATIKQHAKSVGHKAFHKLNRFKSFTAYIILRLDMNQTESPTLTKIHPNEPRLRPRFVPNHQHPTPNISVLNTNERVNQHESSNTCGIWNQWREYEWIFNIYDIWVCQSRSA